MSYVSETIKIQQQDCYISCYFLKSKVLKSEMIELVKMMKTVFTEKRKPITVDFPNIGFSYVFESENDIKNFESTITTFIPYIMNETFSRIDGILDREKNRFGESSSDVVPACKISEKFSFAII